MSEETTLENVAIKLARQDEKLSQVCGGVERIEECLTSTDKSNPGLVFQVDRLNQSEKVRKRGFWVGFTAVISLILERIFH